ncbi:hypothetical protein KY285_030474 [Solanum tuberosum]|nr:hypothetical protein KY285_030474 [Solanum tuberosum]
MVENYIENLVLSTQEESSQTFEGSEGLGFEEATQPEEPIVGEELGEELGRTSASVGEDLGRASAGVREDLGRASVSVGEELGGTSSAAVASDIPEVGSDWESEIEATDDSNNADLSDEGEDEYGSDVHDEVINLRKEKRAAKIKKRKEKSLRSEGVNLGKKGVDLGYDEYLSKKQTTFEGKIAGDEPYFDSDEAVSFEIDTDEDVNEEDELIVWETGLAFESVEQFRETITRYVVQEHVELDKYVNDATRVRVKCTAGCPWLLFGSIDSRRGDFVVKNYNPVHKCNGTTKNKLVNSKYLSERYKDRIISEPGIRVFQFQILVQKELNVYVGRTVARKARNIVLKQIMGDHAEEFKRILDYRDELLKTNPSSTCVVRLSEETFECGRKMFQSFYICFDALKKAFKARARRCIGFDGYFLKGVSRGQLLVAVCKDGNNQMLPLAWVVVEVENTFTWKWFIKLVRHDLELGDGTELTTITDMQKGLDKAIQDPLPSAEQRMCARHVLANWSKN